MAEKKERVNKTVKVTKRESRPADDSVKVTKVLGATEDVNPVEGAQVTVPDERATGPVEMLGPQKATTPVEVEEDTEEEKPLNRERRAPRGDQ